MSSKDSSPDISPPSHEHFDSDTTPSPSASQFSSLDPQILSLKLALHEASLSFSIAADNLFNATQIMSKAAASLADASGYLAKAKSHQRPQTRDLYFDQEHSISSSSSTSPVWQQQSYVLLTGGKRKTAHESQAISTSGEKPDTEGEPQAILQPAPQNKSPLDLTETGEEKAVESYATEDNATCALPGPSDHHTEAQPLPDEPRKETDVTPEAPSHSTTSAVKQSINMQEPNSIGPTESQSPDPALEVHLPASMKEPDPLLNTPVNPQPAVTTSTEPLNSTPKLTNTCVLLDRGCDEWPAVALLCERHPKSICFYKYWTASLNVVSLLKAMVSVPVVFPVSLRDGKPRDTVTKFLSQKSGVLLWPADIALPSVTKLASHPNIHVIHVGEPSTVHASLVSPQSSMVVANRELSQKSALEMSAFLGAHPVSAFSHTCNKQGDGSSLELNRKRFRNNLVKKSVARGFYLGWLNYHRPRNPAWSACELVERANLYASEYLLRGSSSSLGGNAGGPVSLTKDEAKSMKLGEAVQKGILTVS